MFILSNMKSVKKKRIKQLWEFHSFHSLLYVSSFFSKGDVSETVRMFFDESKSFPPAAKSLLTIQEVDASLTRLAQLTKEDEQQSELEDVARK